MASIGHLAIGAAVGAAYSRRRTVRPLLPILGFAFLAVAPDLDLVTSFFGVAPNTPLAHRGITHSVPFALALALTAWLLARGRSPHPGWAGLAVFTALASHGVLDTMSRLGNGPMLFWPATTASYEFPWRPIPGVLAAHHYLTSEAIPTLVIETLLFLPFLAYAFTVLFPVTRARGVEETPRTSEG